jgi:prepilin-type N-terminal cleavage/methylation domain-containing protein
MAGPGAKTIYRAASRRTDARRASRSRTRGFTLVEVVIVVVIMAVAAALVVPSVQAGRNQREVRTTLQHFVAAVREASSKAILQRRTVELWVSTDDRSYALAVPARAGARPDEDSPRRTARGRHDRGSDLDQIEADEGRVVIGRVTLPESASFGDVKGGRVLPSDIVAFPFFPTGGSGGGEIEFVFEHDRSRQAYVVSIDPLISSVDLKDKDS